MTKIRRNVLLCNFDDWVMTAIAPNGENVKNPPLKDYLRYIWTYLTIKKVSYNSRNNLFISRLGNLFRRLFTNTLKPSQP